MNDSTKGKGLRIKSPPLESYTCPGEPYSISYSVHLARLAAFYSKCRECAHRFDADYDWPDVNQRCESSLHSPARSSLIAGETIRGVYLNELDRNKARALGEGLAAVLWDRQPMQGRAAVEPPTSIDSDTLTKSADTVQRGPIVVVGFDERPSSPDIVTGVVLGLRQMGCPVIDLGQSATPIIAHHVARLDAAAGLFVTGAGFDPSFTGLNILDRGAVPASPMMLGQMEGNARNGVGRQTRQIGSHHPQQGLPTYESALGESFHALRPFRIACGSSTRLQPRLLDRLFAKLPCKLSHTPLPTRRRNLLDPEDIDVQRMAQMVVDGQHHLGVVIDEDGERVAFVTDRGRLVKPWEIAWLLIDLKRRENASAKFVASSAMIKHERLGSLCGKSNDGGMSVETLIQRMLANQAEIAFATDGRVWIDAGYPACDAMLVLAHVLQFLSLSDATFSEVVAKFAGQV